MSECNYVYGVDKYEAECNGREFTSIQLAKMQETSTKVVHTKLFGDVTVSMCPFCKGELLTAR